MLKKLLFIIAIFCCSLIPTLAQEDTQSCQSSSFFERVLSQCKIQDNGICDDGEPFNEKDCSIQGDYSLILGHMWFLRAVIVVTIFLYLIQSELSSIGAISVFLLAAYNGAFGTYTPHPISEMTCNIANLGYCFYPKNSAIGWALVIIIALALVIYHQKR